MDKNTDLEILSGLSGSHSYGTAIEESDIDIMSLVVAPSSFYFGLDNWGNSGTKEIQFIDENGILNEHKFYEIKKAINLFSNFNPNIIGLLWLNKYEHITSAGNLLVQNRTIFNSKKVYNTFVGYAYSQLQKMGGIFNDEEESNKLLKLGFQRILDYFESEIGFQRSCKEYGSIANKRLFNGFDPYDSGYLNATLKLKDHTREEIKRIKDGPITGRMGVKRKELRDKYGFDTKFLFHLVRLMRMCNEFLLHPEEGLKVDRTNIDADFLYSIRNGAFTQEQGKQMADDLFGEAEKLLKITDLPDDIDREKINNLSMDIIKMTL